MKRALILFGLLLHVGAVYGQKIHYQKSFAIAFEKGKTEKKLVLLIISSPVKINRTNLPQLPKGTFHTSGIDNHDVIDLYNKNFVCYNVLYSDTAANSLITKYQTGMYPSYLFVDDKGNLVYKETGESSSPVKYIGMSEKAIAAAASGKTLSDYEEKHRQGNINADVLKEYIAKREELGLYDNAKLIDEYVDFLTVKSFQNYDDVLFILKAGPFIYGKAYNLCYTNRKVTDSIYKKEPAVVTSKINQWIINNTIKAAIEKKSVSLAQQTADFISIVWSRGNYRQGQISSENEMLYYYLSVKDTASYYRKASDFYDNYYLNISADSAKKLELKHLDNIQKSVIATYPPKVQKALAKNDSAKKSQKLLNTYVSKLVPNTNSINNTTANTLNSAAYEFYTLGTYNQNYLIKALLWSKRAIELNPTAAYYDTEAHLLYRLGFYDEAKSAQSKALNMAQDQSKEIISRYEAELNKIETHQL